MMIKTCLFILSLSLLNDVEGVHDVLPKPPHNNKDNHLFLVEPGELSKANQMAEQITEQDLDDMLSGSGDLPLSLLEMAGNSSTDDFVMGSIHSLVSTVSLLLNLIVIIFLCCRYPATKFFRSTQYFLIVHVCLSSLLLVATMVASASYRLSSTWYFGRFCCKLNNWLKAFGIVSQAYFCTLLLVELYLQLRHSSFIQRTMENNCRTREKLAIVSIGWMVAFVLSYPFWVRTTFYTIGSRTTCSIDTFDHDDALPFDDYATYMHNGDLVFNFTMDSIAYDDDDLYVDDYDYDNQPYECHMEETSFSFRFWYGSLVIFGYFVPLTVTIGLFAVLKYTKASATAGSKAEVVSAQSKGFVCFLILIFVVCWLPLSIYKAGKVFHGLPLYRDQCLFVRDIGSIMGYFSCLALPAAILLYMVHVQRRNQRRNTPSSAMSPPEQEEKKQLDRDDEAAALCDVITNRCDDSEMNGGGVGGWH